VEKHKKKKKKVYETVEKITAQLEGKAVTAFFFWRS
jgi:hypothetical protein